MDNKTQFDFEKQNQYSFDIIIENLQKRKNQIRALHIMAAFLILVYSIRGLSNLPQTSMHLYLGFPAFIIILYTAIFKKENLLNFATNRLLRIVETVLITLCGIHFWNADYKLISFSFFASGLLLLFTLIVEMQVLNGYQILVNTNGVTTNNGLKKKLIPWKEIEQVLIKDGILTVDLKNNYLIQSKFSNKFDTDFIQHFNHWCKQVTK